MKNEKDGTGEGNIDWCLHVRIKIEAEWVPYEGGGGAFVLALIPCRMRSSAKTSTVSKGTERLCRMFTSVPLYPHCGMSRFPWQRRQRDNSSISSTNAMHCCTTTTATTVSYCDTLSWALPVIGHAAECGRNSLPCASMSCLSFLKD